MKSMHYAKTVVCHGRAALPNPAGRAVLSQTCHTIESQSSNEPTIIARGYAERARVRSVRARTPPCLTAHPEAGSAPGASFVDRGLAEGGKAQARM